MESNRLPDLPQELARRIRLVRRDIGNLLFHFTRPSEDAFVTVSLPGGGTSSWQGTAAGVLRKILHEAKLIGTSAWIRSGEDCVCFTEAPLHEFSTVFRLNELAASKDERPRYEPYGIAVNKEWLFSQGGRPVIYDKPDALDEYPESLRYRFVPYDPEQGIDHSWEREWRIKAQALNLDPKHTLVVVPTADEAADIVYDFAEWEADYDYPDPSPVGAYPVPRWLAVSLDILGFEYGD